MARKQNRRRRTKQKRPSRIPGIKFDTLSFKGEPDALRAAIREAAAENVAGFEARLTKILDLFRTRNPLTVLSPFGIYGLTGVAGADGVSTTGMIKSIEQHHAELLQALLLTLPRESWGTSFCTPQELADLIDAVPALSQTAFYKRLLEGPKTSDGEPTPASALQERIRLHTEAVRNWGYYGEVKRISTELYGPLDAPMRAAIGFGPTDLITVADALVQALSDRAGDWWKALARTLRGGTAKQLVKEYYRNFPDLAGTPEELIANLPPSMTREGMLSYIIWHAELRLPDLMSHSAEDAATLAGVSTSTAEAVLKALSLEPGALQAIPVDHLFLGNPVWTRPMVDLGDRYYAGLPQAVFSHIHEIVRTQAEAAGLTKALNDARASYLEREVERLTRKAFPAAVVSANAKWPADGRDYETDVLAVIDRTVLILEAKSHHLTGPGLRGGPDRMRRHIKELVVEPSVQSARLAEIIAAAKAGDTTAAAAVAKSLGIDGRCVDTVIRLSVTLDDFSVLATAEPELIEAGWVPTGHVLAPTIHLGDLICLTEILERPALLLHYLQERFHLQKSFNLMGDELDFLGLYLSTGFGLSGLDRNAMFNLSGLSKPIDAYFMGLDAGATVHKPKAQLHAEFAAIVDRLAETRPNGWTTTSLDILAAAPFDEQRAVDVNLRALRNAVRKQYRDEGHLSCLVLKPGEDRKAAVMFHLFPEALREGRRDRMSQLAAQTLSELGCDRCVVIGRSIDRWTQPYDCILQASKSEASGVAPTKQ